MAHAQQHAQQHAHQTPQQHPRPTGHPDQTPEWINDLRHETPYDGRHDGGDRHQPYSYRGPGDPYATPGPVPQSAYGQPAKKTMPLAPLSGEVLIPTKEPCWDCHGAGTLKNSKVTQCRVCRIWWSREQVRVNGRRTMWGVLLPCKHEVPTDKVFFVDQPCPTCTTEDNPAGVGYLSNWRKLGDIAEWIRGALGGPGSTEPELHALFARSDVKPTAPPVHITSAPTQLTPSMLPPLPPSDIPSKF